MAGGVILEGDASKLILKLERMARADLGSLNAALAEAARSSTLERFAESRGPDGQKWPLSVRAGGEGGGKTLIQSGALRNSIRSESDATGFAVGTNVRYASTHQFGAKGRIIRAKTKKGLVFRYGGKWIRKKQVTVNIPARPFLGFSQEDLREIQDTAEAFFGEED